MPTLIKQSHIQQACKSSKKMNLDQATKNNATPVKHQGKKDDHQESEHAKTGKKKKKTVKKQKRNATRKKSNVKSKNGYGKWQQGTRTPSADISDFYRKTPIQASAKGKANIDVAKTDSKDETFVDTLLKDDQKPMIIKEEWNGNIQGPYESPTRTFHFLKRKAKEMKWKCRR